MTTKRWKGRAMADALGGAVWRKSSYSGGSEGQCVEIADVRVHGGIAVRDSKNVAGPVLLVSPEAFTHFLGLASESTLERR
ncbi:DUF397 domain-containing protein [Streptomyces tsukubensis]|uniref:DUF397 domain-containing protein n=1 Tax=Streptomyces tsukubensis TaxID=83656 RepID=UPI0036A2A234